MIFQSLMGPGKSRCDVPSGTTQGQKAPLTYIFICKTYSNVTNEKMILKFIQ
jgi:hypothetical protein